MTIDLAWYYDQIKDATLEVVERGEKLQAFLLRKYPDRTMMSSMIIFAPGVIVITGDLRVTNHGVTAIGYGLDWFKMHLDAPYLAEKFLEKTWVPEEAKASFAWQRDEYKKELEAWRKAVSEAPDLDDNDLENPDNPMLRKREWNSCGHCLDGEVTIIEAIDEMLENDDVFSSPDQLNDAIPAYKEDGRFIYAFDSTCVSWGYGYHPAEVGWLAAIQRRFAETYAEMEASHV